MTLKQRHEQQMENIDTMLKYGCEANLWNALQYLDLLSYLLEKYPPETILKL
jgi:hypothetical protein